VLNGFFWVGNHPGVDFVNTEAAGDRGERLELLSTWDDVVGWAAAAGLVATAPNDARAALTGPGADRALDWARTLRTAARKVLDPDGGDAGAGAATLAETVADVPVHLVYRPGAPRGAPPVGASHATDALRLVLALAVLDATALDRSRIRRCDGERCVLLFYDTSRNRARRWCDMAACGNRAKAATHYERTRQGRTSQR
jgi:predicted RNA-binding Zn ribbon-like protein